MKRSVRVYYEHHRSYDLDDFGTPKGKKFVKRRARKRLRGQLKENMIQYGF